MPGQQASLLARIAAKVDRHGPDECWPWTGGTTKGGYAVIRIDRERVEYVHRLVLEEKLGRPLLPGEEVLHSCDNRPCANPAHLSAGTRARNMAEMVERGRSARGERNGSAMLTNEQVLAIISDPRPYAVVVAEHGIHPYHVHRIRRGERWGHLTGAA
jgi:hypothetical protein